MPPSAIRNRVLLRGEESHGELAIVEHITPAGAAGPPLHWHAFDEAFYILEGELTFRVGDEVTTARAGELVLAPRGVPHTLANPTDVPARSLIILAPAGFEREFARRAAREAGVQPPEWALGPIPVVSYVDPR